MSVRVGVTGATGYIGRALIRSVPPDWQIVSLGRRPLAGYEHREADLAQPLPEDLLEGLDYVVHLAADTGSGTVSPEQEVAFARDLARGTRSRRICLLFLSSQACSVDAPTEYGRSKAAIEAAILPLGASVIRPGMVYGGEERGLFGTLCAFLRRLVVRPRLWPSPQVQPIHVDDLCKAVFTVLRDPALQGGIYRVGGAPVSFDDFLATIARYRLRRWRPPVPVPIPALRLALKLAAGLAGPRMRAERLDSLTRLPAMETRADLIRLGLVPRDLRDGMSPAGSPLRRLLIEGRALARSLLVHRAVPNPTLRRYVRALSVHGQFGALDLAPALLANPVLLAALDRPVWRRAASRGSLAWRMELMYRLCESDPAIAVDFLGAGKGSLVSALADFTRAALREGQFRLLHPFAKRMKGAQ